MKISKLLLCIIICTICQGCSSEKPIFEVFFVLIIHLLIILGLIGMILWIIVRIADERREQEQFIKILSVVLGLFIYFAGKGLNLAIPTLIMDSMETTRPIVVGIVGLFSPTLLGIISAYYIKRIFDKKSIIGERIILIFATLLITLFGEVYIASYSTSGNTKLLPNVMFVAGVILYIVLGYTSEEES